MSDSKQERYDRETPFMDDKVEERDLRYDTGDEHRIINEPSNSYTDWTVDDTVAKAAALAKHEEGREQRKAEHERRREIDRQAFDERDRSLDRDRDGTRRSGASKTSANSSTQKASDTPKSNNS